MKKVLILTILLAACSTTTQQRVLTLERSGQILGGAATDLIIARDGVPSAGAVQLAQIGQSFDDAAMLLSSDEPVSASDTVAIKRLVARLTTLIEGEEEQNKEIAEAVALVGEELLGALRRSQYSTEARTLAGAFCSNVARTIFEKLDALRGV